jgi:8-oxo-dGTP diphosphatase
MSDNRFTLRSATYLLLIKKDKVLLLRRFNTGWQDGNYSFVAGHLDGDETVTQTMVREANEEAGITIEPSDLQVVHVMHRKSGVYEYIDFFLVAKTWKNEPKIMETDKCDEMTWFPLTQLPSNLIPHAKKAIECYQNNIPFSEFGWNENEDY